MRMYDTAVMDGKVRRTKDGYLVGTAKVARTGIQLYAGDEVGRPTMPVVRVYRPEEEVFHADAIHSYAFRPVTNDHPPESVNDGNWKKYSAGNTGAEIARDGDYVSVPMVLMDAAAIADYEAGKRELSMGYDATLDFTPGTTPKGEQYDAVQRGLRMNHLALVDRARGGPDLRLGDGSTPGSLDQAASPQTGGRHMADNLRKVVVDGLTIEVTDQGAEAIAKLSAKLADAQSTLDMSREEWEKKMDALKAEMDALKEKEVTDSMLDAMVTERSELIATAKSIADADYLGKTPMQIRRAAVAAKLGDKAIEGKSEAYVDARFDILVEDSKKQPADPMSAALRSSVNNPQRDSANDNGQTAYEKRLADAWKTGGVAK